MYVGDGVAGAQEMPANDTSSDATVARMERAVEVGVLRRLADVRSLEPEAVDALTGLLEELRERWTARAQGEVRREALGYLKKNVDARNASMEDLKKGLRDE